MSQLEVSKVGKCLAQILYEKPLTETDMAIKACGSLLFQILMNVFVREGAPYVIRIVPIGLAPMDVGAI